MVFFRRYALALMLAGPACGNGESDENNGGATVIEPLSPEEAVNELRLHYDRLRSYRYCDQVYPQVCDDLPAAYVLPREGSEDYRVVFFNNQDRTSTWAIFDYLTIDPVSKDFDAVGQFQWREFAGSVDTKGKAYWGVPE